MSGSNQPKIMYHMNTYPFDFVSNRSVEVFNRLIFVFICNRDFKF